MKKNLFWTSLLSYLEVQSVYLCTSFFLNVVYSTKEDWTHFGRLINILLAILVGGAACLYPFFMLIMLLKNFPQIRNGNELFKQRWGYMFEQLHIPLLSSKLKYYSDGKSSIIVVFYTQLRQVAFAAGLVGMVAKPFFSMFFFNFSTLIALILVGMLRPYTLPSTNYREMLNEFGILVLNYHLLCLTDFVHDPSTREIIGYSLCSCISVILICNIVVVAVDLFK